MRPCPYCAQTIGDNVFVCPFCNANLAGSYAGSSHLETSGKAIGSLVCGLLFFFPPSAVLAVVMGHLSMSDIRRSAGRLGGKGLAISGLVLGYIGLAFTSILIIGAIAIPNLLRAKMAANEASTVSSLRIYSTALTEYAVKCPKQGYPPSSEYIVLDSSRPISCPQVQINMRNGLRAGALPVKWGYRFYYIPMEKDAAGRITKYGLSANPMSPGITGERHFYTDETGVIRFSFQGGADSKSPPYCREAPCAEM
jgi:hypothetical protein